MPLELALLPVVESAFDRTPYSRARASGRGSSFPYRLALWPEAGLVVRRPAPTSGVDARALDYLPVPATMNSTATGCWPSRLQLRGGAVERAVT